jgi:hypothetical protein
VPIQISAFYFAQWMELARTGLLTTGSKNLFLLLSSGLKLAAENPSEIAASKIDLECRLL